MTAVVIYFQVHQPYRLRPYTYLDVGRRHDYFDEGENERICRRVAERCYVPMNELLLRVIEETGERFRVAFSISGTCLSQLEAWAPEALVSFQRLAETGCVEFLAETSRHSLAAVADEVEFTREVEHHRDRITALFGERPVTFRNTELIFDERLAQRLERLGFDVLLGEGADRLLRGRSPHVVYRPRGCERLKLLLRDYRYSDDIAFRFSNRDWSGYPLLADTFVASLEEVPLDAPFVGLFMDYETFGEHQSVDTGIFDFMEYVPRFVLESPRFSFKTPVEVAEACESAEVLAVPDWVSWADAERDLSAWLDNPMQKAAHAALYDLAADVRRAAGRGYPELLEDWCRLTTSDHVYYMATKHASDGDVHEYFSNHASPHDSFIVFMNVLEDLGRRVRRALSEPIMRPARKSGPETPPAAGISPPAPISPEIAEPSKNPRSTQP